MHTEVYLKMINIWEQTKPSVWAEGAGGRADCNYNHGGLRVPFVPGDRRVG